jgi:hypothetical protein
MTSWFCINLVLSKQNFILFLLSIFTKYRIERYILAINIVKNLSNILFYVAGNNDV